MTESIRLQVSIGGFAPAGQTPEAVTVLGELDLPTGALLVDIAKNVPAGRPEVRIADNVVCTNNADTQDRDVLFLPEDFRDAVRSYFDFVGRGLLALEGTAERMNPSAKIEPDGIDEHGPKYRFAPDISNGQIAVVVLCWLAQRHSAQLVHGDALDDFAEAQSFYSIGIGGQPDKQRYIMGGQIVLGPDGWPV